MRRHVIQVTRYYPGKFDIEAIIKRTRVRYGDVKKFIPSLRILSYVSRDGMAYVTLLFNLMMDDVGEVTLPIYPVNKEVCKLQTYIGRMIKKKELERKKERPRINEIPFYQIISYFYRFIRRGRKIDTTIRINNRDYKIRSLSEDEIMETMYPSFWIVGSKYIIPTSPKRVAQETGYQYNTVINVNSILRMYGFIKRTRDGCVFKNKEKAFKFLKKSEERRNAILTRIKKFVRIMEEDSPILMLAQEYDIHPQTIRKWKEGIMRPYRLPEGGREWLRIPNELWKKAKKYGIIGEPEEEFEEMEFLLDHPFE